MRMRASPLAAQETAFYAAGDFAMMFDPFSALVL
jgi:hypothetical protein